MPGPLVLFTDFGLRDPYVGVMKGVLAGIAPQVPVLDLTHGVPPQDVEVGATWLDGAVDWFPDGSIFVCVVDPGVGGDRALLLVQTPRWWFLAPDNGLLSAVLDRYLVRGCWDVSHSPRRGPSPSHTFHGRDILAPVAGWLARGIPAGELGTPQGAPRRLDLGRPTRDPGGVEGRVVFADGFGNLVTDIRREELRDGDMVRLGDQRLRVEPTYGAVPPGHLLALVGSTGRLEIAVNQGDASARLGLGAGASVTVEACAPVLEKTLEKQWETP